MWLTSQLSRKEYLWQAKETKKQKPQAQEGPRSQWTLTARLRVQTTCTGAILSNEDKVPNGIIVIHTWPAGTSQAHLVIGR